MSSLTFRPKLLKKDQSSCQKRLVLTASTWDGKGPYDVSRTVFPVHAPLNKGKKTATLTAHYPVEKGTSFLSELKCPLVLFTSGFKMISSFYTPYVVHLASWGYVVLQYDLYDFTKNPLSLFEFYTDIALLNCYDTFIKDLEHHVKHLKLPFEVEHKHIGVAGHSRGGKLSALLATTSEHAHRVKAMFLIDPVNFVPPIDTADFPSAVKALAHHRRKMGVAGSSVCGACNPESGNFETFFAEATKGSCLTTIPEAGHMQFLKAPGLIQIALNLLCSRGSTSNDIVIPLTSAFLVAWLENNLRTDLPKDHENRNKEFFEWVKKQKSTGAFSFKEK